MKPERSPKRRPSWLAAVGLSLLASGGLLAGSSPPSTAVAGIDAVLAPRAVAPVAPERTMLMAVTRAGERLVAVGEQGGVVLSDDRGKTWRSARSVPVSATLTGVRFADATTGWAIGHLGVVLKTTDGGETWTQQLDGRAIAQLALAAARTTDAKADAKALVDDGPDKPLLDLLVDDARHVTLVGAFNLALRTDDGGRHWRFVSSSFDNPNRMHLYGIARLGQQLMGVGEQATVLMGTDELHPVKAPYDGSFFGVLPIDEHTVLIYGLRGNAFVSTDGGRHWSAARVQGGGASFNAALKLKDGRVLLGDQAGGVFASRDGGAHFERLAFAWGAPLTGMAEAGDGSVVLSSLAGIATLPAQALSSFPAVSVANKP